MRRPELLAACLLLAACASDGERAAEADAHGAPSSEGMLNLALAENYLSKGELDEAARRAEMALRSDPAWARAPALRAVIYDRAGDAAKAERAFAHALELDGKDGVVLNAYAVWLCERGDRALADRQFSLALADPRYQTPLQALVNAGKCAVADGRFAAASDYLRRALVFAPDDRFLLYTLAELELRQGRAFEARAFIQRRDAQGADAPTLDLAARIEDAAGNPLAAARYRARLQKEFPAYAPTGEGARSP